MLLSQVEPENVFGRGTLGQSIYMLLVEDSGYEGLVEKVVERALHDGNMWAAELAALLLVYWAGDNGRERLAQLRGKYFEVPTLDSLEWQRVVQEHGWINLQ